MNRDDIPRVERPAGWVPRWSKADVDGYRQKLARVRGALTPPSTPAATWRARSTIGSWAP